MRWPGATYSPASTKVRLTTPSRGLVTTWVRHLALLAPLCGPAPAPAVRRVRAGPPGNAGPAGRASGPPSGAASPPSPAPEPASGSVASARCRAVGCFAPVSGTPDPVSRASWPASGSAGASGRVPVPASGSTGVPSRARGPAASRSASSASSTASRARALRESITARRSPSATRDPASTGRSTTRPAIRLLTVTMSAAMRASLSCTKSIDSRTRETPHTVSASTNDRRSATRSTLAARRRLARPPHCRRLSRRSPLAPGPSAHRSRRFASCLPDSSSRGAGIRPRRASRGGPRPGSTHSLPLDPGRPAGSILPGVLSVSRGARLPGLPARARERPQRASRSCGPAGRRGKTTVAGARERATNPISAAVVESTARMVGKRLRSVRVQNYGDCHHRLWWNGVVPPRAGFNDRAMNLFFVALDDDNDSPDEVNTRVSEHYKDTSYRLSKLTWVIAAAAASPAEICQKLGIDKQTAAEQQATRRSGSHQRLQRLRRQEPLAAHGRVVSVVTIPAADKGSPKDRRGLRGSAHRLSTRVPREIPHMAQGVRHAVEHNGGFDSHCHRCERIALANDIGPLRRYRHPHR